MTLNELWEAPGKEPFKRPAALATGRYLAHTIAPDAICAYAVRLRMHGEIKLKDWYPFSAEQVIHCDRGMIWKATVRVHGVPIPGSDSCINGTGSMHWKILGLLPVVNASGLDVSRSSAGRVNIESIWLPTLLSGDQVHWTSPDSIREHASFAANGEGAEIDFVTDESGALRSVSMPRWGNPRNSHFHYVDFGALIDDEKTFQGFTIPTRLRVGWFFGSPRFETEGEFFRATIESAVYR